MALWFAAIALALVAFGGLTAAIDAAYQSLSRNDVANLGAGKSQRRFDAIAADVPSHLNAVNFVRVLCETFAAILVALMFVSLGYDLTQSLVASAIAMTVVVFVLVGSSPRSVGRAHPMTIARWTGGIVRAMRLVLGPLTIALVGIGNAVTPGRARTTIQTERQLLSMVDEATESDAIEEEDRDLIRSIFDFGDTILREVMVARTEMVALDSTVTVDEALGQFLSAGFSRMPVVGVDNDDVIGIAHIKDTARFVRAHPDRAKKALITELVRPALFLPEVKMADEALRVLQSESNHMALIVDEYGGIAGLVTMEDLIEEVLGEISDEYDEDDVDIVDLGDGSLRVNASTNIDDLAEHLDIPIVEDDVDTLGGLFVKNFGRFPDTGDAVTVSGLELVADRVERRRKRLVTVLVRIVDPS
jgi:CBS domain containing-hemolysin-like protein